MKRKCTKIKCSLDGRRAIYVDDENKQQILDYINSDARHKKKFLHICDLLLSNLRNSELYDKEEINDQCKGITAMKFFKGQENDRIYCKEVTTEQGVHIIITSELHQRKKTTKLTQAEKNIIKKVAGYEYEIGE